MLFGGGGRSGGGGGLGVVEVLLIDRIGEGALGGVAVGVSGSRESSGCRRKISNRRALQERMNLWLVLGEASLSSSLELERL